MTGPLGETDLKRQVELLAAGLLQLQEIVGRLIQHPPVQLHVEHMEVEQLAFNVAGVDVEQLSGQLNLGLTHIFQPGEAGGERPGAQAAAPGPQPGAGPQPEPGSQPGPGSQPEPDLPWAPIWPEPDREGESTS